MESASLVAMMVTAALAAVSVVFTVQFARGEWLLFLVGRQVFDLDDVKREKAVRSARLMACVTGALALLLVTIIVYKYGRISGDSGLATVGLWANNIAFVVFVAALIAFYAIERHQKNASEKLKRADAGDTSKENAKMARRMQKARVDTFPTATLVFLVCVAVVAFVTGILFSTL